MEKLIPLFACLLIGAAMLMEIEQERITMCNRQGFVDGPVYVDGTVVCSCQILRYSLHCTNMSQNSLSQFQRTFSQFHIDHLIIHDSNFSEINSRSFENMSVHFLQFNNAKIENFHLFSGPNRFQGRINSLSLFECEFYNWDLTYLPTFLDLKQIDIVDPVNPVTDYNVTKYLPNSTKFLKLTNCGLCSIGQISSRIIFTLELGRNNLTTIKRSALPRPSNHLRFIDLSDNPIVSLPEDAFTEMRNLYFVTLTNTLLTTLSFNLFQQVLIGRISYLVLRVTIHGIPLHCDNKIAWMKNPGRVKINDQNVICKSPEDLAGMRLKDVDLS